MYDNILLEDQYDADNSFSIDKVNTDLDSLFNNLSNDVTNVNKIINEVTEKRKSNEKDQKIINESKLKLEKAQKDFEEYMNLQKEELKKSKIKIDEYARFQQEKLKKAEENFRESMSNSLSELEIEKKTLLLEKEQFKQEKEQFMKYKEVAHKKIELENKNIEQKVVKFRELMNQFNSNFKPIFDEE